MKKFIRDFIHRGLTACGLGPLVLAVFYGIFQHQTGIETLTVDQVCLGIFSLTVLAFVAGGINAIYRVERLPLMAAILIHGSVLYVCYLVTYLLNHWLERGITPILVFSGIFVAGFLLIWWIIYLIIRRRTDRLNQLLQKKQANR